MDVAFLMNNNAKWILRVNVIATFYLRDVMQNKTRKYHICYIFYIIIQPF